MRLKCFFAFLCFTLSGIVAHAATYGDFTYTSNGSAITITDYPTSATGAVTIPSTIVGLPVTSIGSYAFYGCSGLTSVTIPSSVTSIGYSAFEGCSGLTGTLTIPSSVTSIGDYAFRNCSGLTGTLTIPNSVTSM